MILSLQGCMAVGKTMAVRYLQEKAPYVHISYEINTDIIDEVKQRQLDKNKYEDYLEIQKLWLDKEVVRYNKAKEFPYPITIGQKWEIENALKKELEQVRKCMPTRILFLDASNEVLRKHKENDNTRSRNFFEHHLKHLLPLKRQWFIGKENVDVLNVDNLNADEVGKKVKEWVDFCIEHY